MKYSELFITKTRKNGENYVCLKEDRIDLQELIMSIHNKFNKMPNDWLYEKISHLFTNLENYPDEDIMEVCDGLLDVDYGDLINFLECFHGEVNETIKGDDFKDLYCLIQKTQYDILIDIANIIKDFLSDKQGVKYD